MSFKKLSSVELAELTDKERELYQAELMSREPFDHNHYVERAKIEERKPNKPAFRPKPLDDEKPEEGYSILAIIPSEYSELDGMSPAAITTMIKEQIASNDEHTQGVVGSKPALEPHVYEGTLNGVPGYKPMVMKYFTIEPENVGFKILDIEASNLGVRVSFVPHGPKAGIVQSWIDNRDISFRLYPRIGKTPSGEPTFIVFDMDYELLLP